MASFAWKGPVLQVPWMRVAGFAPMRAGAASLVRGTMHRAVAASVAGPFLVANNDCGRASPNSEQIVETPLHAFSANRSCSLAPSMPAGAKMARVPCR